MRSCEFATPNESRSLTFPRAARERIRDEPAFEVWLAHVDDRMVQHTLGEARRGDDSFFRIVDDELLKSA